MRQGKKKRSPQGGRSQRRLLTDKPATWVGSAQVALSHVGTRPQLTDTAWRIIQNEVTTIGVHHVLEDDLGLLVLLALLWPGTA